MSRILLGLMTLGIVCLSSPSQSDAWQSPPGGQAVLALDFDLARLSKSPLGAVMDQAREMTANEGTPAEIAMSASRFTAAISAPENIQDLMSIGPGQPVPFDFYLRVQFEDAAAKQVAMEHVKEGFDEITENGKKVFQPNHDGPSNVRLQEVDSTTIEMGTTDYLKRSDRNFHSAGLAKIWKSMPDHAVRVAADFDGARELVDGAMEMLGEEAPAQAKPLIDMLGQIASLKLTVDAQDKNMLSLSVVGRDEKSTSDFHSNLDGFLNMAKFASGTQMEEIKQNSPKMAEVAAAVVASLKAVKNGNTVSVDVPRPEGLDAALKEAIESAKKAGANAQDMNRFRQAALAVHNYHDSMGKFPFAELEEGSHKISWRVHILPYMEEQELWTKIEKDEAWDSSANRTFHEKMPEYYGHGSSTESDICRIITPETPSTFVEIADGTSNTIMFLQNPKGFPWMSPRDLTIVEAVELVSQLPEGGHVVAVFYDGSVRQIQAGFDSELLKSMILPNDGK